MDGEAAAKLPVRVAPAAIAPRPAGAIESRETTTTSSSSSTLSPPAPGLLHYVEAALKRHRPLGGMPSHNLRPRRFLVPSQNKQEAILFKEHGAVLQKADLHSLPSKGTESLVNRTPADPSFTESMQGSCNAINMQMNQPKSDGFDDDRNLMPLSNAVSPTDQPKKVQFSVGETAVSQEMEWNHNLIEESTVVDRDLKHQSLPNREVDATSRSDFGISSSLAKRTALVQDRLHPFRTFLKQPAISQSSGMGTSCATTTSVHSTSAPLINTTYTFRSQQDDVSQLGPESVGYLKSSCQSVTEEHQHRLHELPLKETVATADERSANVDGLVDIENLKAAKEEMGKMEKQTAVLKDPASTINQSVQGKNSATDNNRHVASSLEGKMGPQSGKQDKAGSCKGAAASSRRNYDPDCFFKVNGKLYQRLGKIGSGGSSEVHKVISSDCTIYALKKIKLKGRDYSTAYGFCQEIKYLNRLKGKDNIIQLIDYEVTDKALLEEVMSDSMSNQDGRMKGDGYIYMILEYGEIDLARMLCQKWKKLDSSEKAIDENWLRFYWQQILHAVNIIHEERIVHSDLKPANFLLVRGSLKLIDFGIAKAISCDTTNIQRDSQVGTLSYMSPEAFMCNESDPNGNVIKCGRPSDIWSLGCILYQMVYGRTPFSEYKTFWSKFKVITDPDHEITYEPLANLWLLDLMKKCLVWDRNQRWRIPQLLEHPFLVPPVPSNMPPSREQGCEMIRIISEACQEDQEASALCSKLKQLLEEPMTELKCQSSVTSSSRAQQFLLLSHVSNVCLQIQEHLMKPEQT